MSGEYNSRYFPPIPVLPLVLSTDSGQTDSLLGLVDTGADATIIPERLALEINANPINPGQLKTQWGEAHPITFYLVDVKIEQVVLPGVLVAGDAHSTEIVVGRDVLNKLVLCLDGPRQQTELLDDTITNRLRARRDSR